MHGTLCTYITMRTYMYTQLYVHTTCYAKVINLLLATVCPLVSEKIQSILSSSDSIMINLKI